MSTSDFSDSDVEVDPLDESFTEATAHVQRIHAAQLPDDLLELYALYKQATVGQCNTAKPSIFNMQNRAKWCAWHDLGEMSAADAKLRYVEKVKKLDASWYEQLIAGQKFKSPHSWVVHSVHQVPEDCEFKAEHEKNAFDFVKEGDLSQLRKRLTAEQMQQLDEHGMGLIHWATDRNALQILEYLIANGVDVNMRDADQQTALHYAASCGHLDCLRLLLGSNADRNIKDAEGQTCLDVADTIEVHALLNISPM